jgi:acyl-CoA synthetase (AMP-forming)/AMP-acid ligase II
MVQVPTIGALFAGIAGDQPDRTALIIDDDTYTYGQLQAAAERRARQLRALGARRGDRIGVMLPNGADYLELLGGAALIGAILVPINVRFKAAELRYLIVNSGMIALVMVQGIEGIVDFIPLLREAFADLPDTWPPMALKLAGAPELKAIARLDGDLPETGGDLPPPPTSEDPLLLMYTSGTTANPKGCVISHSALMANCRAIVERFSLGARDLWWCPLPMFHIGGLLFPLTMFAAGGVYAGMRHFTPSDAIRMLQRYPPTVFYPLFPTIALAVIEHPEFAGADLSRVKMVCNVAPPDVQQRIQDAIPQAPLVGAFGMTEASGTVVYGSCADPADKRLTTCGTPLTGWEVRVLDQDTGRPLPVGERGELAIRGDALFDRYWGDGELSAGQMIADGFFKTGDVGSIDQDGFVSFHGRFKDQLKVGGENVSALEVESFLATHPAVHLAQVVGVDDERYGEVPAAFIELKPGHALNEAAVKQFCEGRIARFKVPRYVRFVEQWPMSATKILKYRLRQQIADELASPQ